MGLSSLSRGSGHTLIYRPSGHCPMTELPGPGFQFHITTHPWKPTSKNSLNISGPQRLQKSRFVFRSRSSFISSHAHRRFDAIGRSWILFLTRVFCEVFAWYLVESLDDFHTIYASVGIKLCIMHVHIIYSPSFFTFGLNLEIRNSLKSIVILLLDLRHGKSKKTCSSYLWSPSKTFFHWHTKPFFTQYSMCILYPSWWYIHSLILCCLTHKTICHSTFTTFWDLEIWWSSHLW